MKTSCFMPLNARNIVECITVLHLDSLVITSKRSIHSLFTSMHNVIHLVLQLDVTCTFQYDNKLMFMFFCVALHHKNWKYTHTHKELKKHNIDSPLKENKEWSNKTRFNYKRYKNVKKRECMSQLQNHICSSLQFSNWWCVNS